MTDDTHITKKRILIVDDEPTLLFGSEMALIGPDRDISCLTSGQAALDALETETYDLVVLDLNMPGLTGLDVLRELRLRGDQTKAIICSAHITERAIISAVSNGVVDFLAKPMSLTGLREFVAYALDDESRIKSGLDEAFEKVRALDFKKAVELLESKEINLQSGRLVELWTKLLRIVSSTPIPSNSPAARKCARALIEEAVVRC